MLPAQYWNRYCYLPPGTTYFQSAFPIIPIGSSGEALQGLTYRATQAEGKLVLQ